MPSFTIRMVLHGASWEEYIELADEMATEGFVDVIKGESGKSYKLPDAEYIGQAVDLKTAMAKAKAAATRVGKKFAVLVTESNGRTWQGLEEV